MQEAMASKKELRISALLFISGYARPSLHACLACFIAEGFLPPSASVAKTPSASVAKKQKHGGKQEAKQKMQLLCLVGLRPLAFIAGLLF
jgi:hypothetical protein